MLCTRLLRSNIIAYRQAVVFAGRNGLCFRDCESKIVSSLIINRNLYQTVKKRALEARAKLRKIEQPSNRPCPEPPESCDEDASKKKYVSQGQDNTKSLNAGSCCPKIPVCGNEKDANRKMILAALAAAGLGALAMFLLTSLSKSEPKPPPAFGVSQMVPESSKDIPKKVPYLLIGGGTASFSAFRAIKSNDPTAKVLVITNELWKPYMRPPLSKELWYASEPGSSPKGYRFKQWTGSERSLFFEPEEFFVNPTKLMESPNGGIAVAQGYTVRKIDPKHRIATLTDGTEIKYGKCLLATGCTPKTLPVFANAPKNVQEWIMFYRSPNDFEKLKSFVDAKKSITIIGSGFLGSELCCSLATYSKGNVKINQIYSESGNMSKVLPEYLSKWTTKKVEQLGVCVVPNVQVKEISRDQAGLKLTLNNGQTVLTDRIVLCVGCEANTDIASVSGLEVDGDLGGFVVNAELEARQNLFVAGDASCFYDPLLGRRRLEHHDHSVISGRLAGENMVAKENMKKPYEHQSMFWSDLGPGIGYEGIGRTDASLPTVGVFALPSSEPRKTDNLEPTTEKSDDVKQIETSKGGEQKSGSESVVIPSDPTDNYGRGVIFYLQDDKIVGILLWNIFNRIGLARTIVNQNKSYKDLNEVAKLFEIHS